MLELKDPLPVKVFAAVLWGTPEAWSQACTAMARIWGTCDCITDPVAFTYSDYYLAEMGPELKRQLVSFEPLVDPGDLPELKLAANTVEAQLCQAEKRTVNIDVGYLDYHKVVLASTKDGPRKVYVGKGMWADMCLIYEKGAFHPLPWTFMDLKSGIYDAFFQKTRMLYKESLRRQYERNGSESDLKL